MKPVPLPNHGDGPCFPDMIDEQGRIQMVDLMMAIERLHQPQGLLSVSLSDFLVTAFRLTL